MNHGDAILLAMVGSIVPASFPLHGAQVKKKRFFFFRQLSTGAPSFALFPPSLKSAVDRRGLELAVDTRSFCHPRAQALLVCWLIVAQTHNFCVSSNIQGGTFIVGSYKLPLSQYTCIGLVVAWSFQQKYDFSLALLRPADILPTPAPLNHNCVSGVLPGASTFT